MGGHEEHDRAPANVHGWFAHDLGASSAGTAHEVLLFANGAGGVIGGIVALCLGTLAAGIYALRDRPAPADPRAPTH